MGSWSEYDLQAYNISIVPTSSLTTFFGIQELPQSPFSNSVILNSKYKPDNNDGLSEDEAEFFFYLSAVEDTQSQLVEPAVYDLAAFLLRLCCFSSRDRFILHRTKSTFRMVGKDIDAVVNVSLVNELGQYLLLVQEDKVCTLSSFFTIIII